MPATRRPRKLQFDPGNHPDRHPDSPLLTVDEAAAYLRCIVTYVYRVLRHEIPVVKFGRRVFFERRDLDAYIANSRER